MSEAPKAFLSYSHADKEYAKKLAADLFAQGIKVWFDDWEIQPGDSIVQKIFTHGIAGQDFFLILLSKESTSSKWVREEMDVAMVQRIEGVTRIVPLIKEDCEIPVPLRSLHWVNLADGYEEGLKRLVKALHGVTERPPLGQPPAYVTGLSRGFGGMSARATTVAELLLRTRDDSTGVERDYNGPKLHEELPFIGEEDINDAVAELESYGLVRVFRYSGIGPYNFGAMNPTYALFLGFRTQSDYDPEEDIRCVAAAVAARDSLRGDALREMTDLPPTRINRAVNYLADYGYVEVLRSIGNAPYDFLLVTATWRTRQFVETHCR